MLCLAEGDVGRLNSDDVCWIEWANAQLHDVVETLLNSTVCAGKLAAEASDDLTFLHLYW